jgi:hypothetical protein
MYVYFYSLHVSGSHVPIIRIINCINTTSDICHSVQMTVWCAGLGETAVLSKPARKRIVPQVGYLQRHVNLFRQTKNKLYFARVMPFAVTAQ